MLHAKILYTGLMVTLLYLEGVFLGLSQEKLLVALIGSVCGSLTLTYFRTALSGFQRILKILMSSIGGVFIGTALVTYFRLEQISYIGAVYFLTSFVILIFLRAILNLTEKNASGIVTTIFQRAFRINGDGIQKETKIVTAGTASNEMKNVHNGVVTQEISDENEVETIK